MKRICFIKVAFSLAMFFSLTAVITGPKDRLDPFLEDNEYLIRVGALFQTEDSQFIETEESKLMAIKVANYFRKNFNDRRINKKIIVERYFPETCFLPGTLLARYKPDQINTNKKSLYFLFILDENPLESPWDLIVKGCGNKPSSYIRFKEKNENLPEVKRKTEECLRIKPEKIVKRNFCMAKIVIDYGMFE